MPRRKPWRGGKRQGTCGNPSKAEKRRIVGSAVLWDAASPKTGVAPR